MNMTCIHNFQFTTIRVTGDTYCYYTGVFIFISVLLTMPSKYSFSLGSFFVCAREANLVHNHCMDLEYIYIYTLLSTLCIYYYTKKYDYTLYITSKNYTYLKIKKINLFWVL